MSREFNDTYRKPYFNTRSVNVKLFWIISDDDSDANSDEQFNFTYTKEDRPEAIVNAAYRYLNRIATTDKEAYSLARTHRIHIIFARTNAGQILWDDEMKCSHCLDYESDRIPYLNGQCKNCKHLAKTIFDYHLDNNTTIWVGYDMM